MDPAQAHHDGLHGVQELRDLELLVRSSTPLIVVETHEEERILQLITRLAHRLPKPLFKWTSLTTPLVPAYIYISSSMFQCISDFSIK